MMKLSINIFNDNSDDGLCQVASFMLLAERIRALPEVK